MKERVCRRCQDSWPDDEEFYKPGALDCLACQFELRQGYKRKAQARFAALPLAEQERRKAAERERSRKKDKNRYWGKKQPA